MPCSRSSGSPDPARSQKSCHVIGLGVPGQVVLHRSQALTTLTMSAASRSPAQIVRVVDEDRHATRSGWWRSSSRLDLYPPHCDRPVAGFLTALTGIYALTECS